MSVHESPPEGSLPLGDFIRQHAAQILDAWERRMRQLPAARPLSRMRLLNHMPELLDRLATVLGGGDAPELERLPEHHAIERLGEGFDMEVVAAEYGLLRECVFELFGQTGAALSVHDARRFDRVIDDAIIASAARYARTRERTLLAMDRIAEVARGSGDPDDFFPRLLTVLLETAEAVDSVVLFLKEGELLRVRAAVGSEAELAETRFSLKLGEGFAGRVAAERRPLELRAAAGDPMVKGAVTRMKGIRALFGVPLICGEAVLGVARIGSCSSYEFSVEDKLLIRALVERLSSLIVEVHLRERERAARAKAEESLALVNAVLAHAPAGIALVDSELRYLQVNEALAALNRFPREAHEGKTLMEVLPPGVAEHVVPQVRQVLQTGQPVRAADNVYMSRDGRVLQSDYFPVRTSEGRLLGVGAVVVDVTRLKSSEDTLRAKRDLLESLLQAQSDVGQGFAIGEGGRFTFVNEALCRLSGYTPDELLGLPSYLELVVPEERAAVEGQVSLRRLTEGASAHLETAIRHKHGYRVELELTVKRLVDGRLIALARDITERKQAQQDREQLLAVVQTERRSMEAVLESLPVGVLLAEGPSGRIVRGNPRVEQMLGHPIYFSAEVEHYDEWRGLHPDGQPYRNEDWPLARALRTGEVVCGEEMVFSRPDGERRTLSANAAPVRDEAGAVVAAVLALDDITERKRAEDQLTRALSFRDQLISILGHDLRNPLGAIKMSSELVRRHPALPRALLKTITRIDHSAERMRRMIDDLLDFAKSRFQGALPVSPIDVDLHEIARAAVDELTVIHPDRALELTLRGDGRGCWDPGRMAQLVSNLVANALQHGDPRKPVKVSVTGADKEVLLEVRNQGEPIPPAEIPRLFEPFRRGSTSVRPGGGSPKGLGLGLYIVRQIVQAHGGSLDVRSTREKGTCFSVRLPRRCSSAPPGPVRP